MDTPGRFPLGPPPCDVFERFPVDALALLCCHELVHAWHSRPDLDTLPVVTAPNEAAVLTLAHEQAWPAPGQLPERERLVDAVALSWFCAAEGAPAA